MTFQTTVPSGIPSRPATTEAPLPPVSVPLGKEPAGFVDQGGYSIGTSAGRPNYQCNGEARKNNGICTAGAVAIAQLRLPERYGSQFSIVVGKGAKK